MAQLQRITTEYLDSEDRIRLAGDCGPQAPVVLWLTQRLLNRLVPHLLHWLEQQANGGTSDAMGAVLQGFAQHAAMASLPPQPPVQCAPHSPALLVHTVNLVAADEGVQLTFRCNSSAATPDDAEPWVLSMHAQPLRQWLGILHELYRKAEWPLAVWPGWVGERPGAVGQKPQHLLH